jgi:UDP-glucose 4-epimerase
MRYFLTGCAGFIGSNILDRLVSAGHQVVGFDNFSSGRREFIKEALAKKEFTLVTGNLLDKAALTQAMRGTDVVIHMAANADVRHGTERPTRDLEQNVIATHNVLEAMRSNGVGTIAFASTGSVYGEPLVFPTPEDCPFPIQTSLYAASKISAEAFIAAYCFGFGMRSVICRFVSILGERYTHGHVFDFYRKLQADASQIEVLGDGRQRKSYLYVQDCVDAVLLALENAEQLVNVFNVGADEYCTVDDSLGWICEELGVTPRRNYTGGQRGWIGDSPFIFLDCTRLRGLGWRPTLTIRDSVANTVNYLKSQPWLFEPRV